MKEEKLVNALKEVFKKRKELHKPLYITTCYDENRLYEINFHGAGFNNCASRHEEIIYTFNAKLKLKESKKETIAPEILCSGWDDTDEYIVEQEDKSLPALIMTHYSSQSIDGSSRTDECRLYVYPKEFIPIVNKIIDEYIDKTYHIKIDSYVQTKTWYGGFIISVKQRKVLSPHAQFFRKNHYFLLPGKYIQVTAGGYRNEVSSISMRLIRVKSKNEIERSQEFTIIPELYEVYLPERIPLLSAIQKIINVCYDMSNDDYHTIPHPYEEEFSKNEMRAIFKLLDTNTILLED